MSETTEQQVDGGSAPLYVTRDFKFSFKKQKVTDAEGNAVKRPPVTLNLPVPTFEGMMAAMKADPKVKQLFLDAAEDLMKDHARSLLTAEDKPVMKQSELPLDQFTLEFIANIPRSERAGSDISEETWKAFKDSYVEIMGALRTPEKAEKAANIFVSKFAGSVKTDKDILRFLQEQLAIWATNLADKDANLLDELSDVFSFLDNRINVLLTKDATATLESL